LVFGLLCLVFGVWCSEVGIRVRGFGFEAGGVVFGFWVLGGGGLGFDGFGFQTWSGVIKSSPQIFFWGLALTVRCKMKTAP